MEYREEIDQTASGLDFPSFTLICYLSTRLRARGISTTQTPPPIRQTPTKSVAFESAIQVFGQQRTAHLQPITINEHAEVFNVTAGFLT